MKAWNSLNSSVNDCHSHFLHEQVRLPHAFHHPSLPQSDFELTASCTTCDMFTTGRRPPPRVIHGYDGSGLALHHVRDQPSWWSVTDRDLSNVTGHGDVDGIAVDRWGGAADDQQ